MLAWLKRVFVRSRRTSENGTAAPVPPAPPVAETLPGPPEPARTPPPPPPPAVAPQAAPPTPAHPSGAVSPPGGEPTVQLIFADGSVESVIPEGSEARHLRYLVDNLLPPDAGQPR